MLKTKNMHLVLPENTNKINKQEGTYGQDWADIINRALTLVDAHDHSFDNGVQISSDNININSNFDLNYYSAESLLFLSVVQQDGLVPLKRSIFTDDGINFFYKDGNDNTIKFTNSGGINLPAIKGFEGDFLSSGASAVYVNNNKSYYFYNNNSIGLANCEAENFSVINLSCNTITGNRAILGKVQDNGLPASDLRKFLYFKTTTDINVPAENYHDSYIPNTYVYINKNSETAINTFKKDARTFLFDTAPNYHSFPISNTCDYVTNYTINNASFNNRIKILTGPVPNNYQMDIQYRGYIVSCSLVCKFTEIAAKIINSYISGVGTFGVYSSQVSIDQNLNGNVHFAMYNQNERISDNYSHYFIMYLEPI